MSTLAKYLLFSSLLFGLLSCSSPEETQNKKVKIPNKITLLFVTQPSCPSCDKLEETMAHKKPNKLLRKYFNVKKIYLGEKLPDGLIKPNGTPTVYFLGADNEVLVEPMIGEKDETELLEFLADALFEFKKTYKIDLIKKLEEKNAEQNKKNI